MGSRQGFHPAHVSEIQQKKRNMNHTDFYARIRAIKEMEYRELYAAIELHGVSYEWNSNDGECPVIAVNTGSVQLAPADVLICRVTIENGNLRLYGVENEYGNEVNFRPDEAFAGHLSYIIDCLPPVNGVDDVTTLKTEEEAV